MKIEVDINFPLIPRGGSWYSFDVYVQGAYRLMVVPGFPTNFLGFRLVRTLRTDKQIERWRKESEEGLFDGK